MTPNENGYIDHFAIEREAQRLRSEAIRSGARAFGAWLRTRFHAAPARHTA